MRPPVFGVRPVVSDMLILSQILTKVLSSCGDPSNGLTCTEAGQQYSDAIKSIANKSTNDTVGGAYLSPIKKRHVEHWEL